MAAAASAKAAFLTSFSMDMMFLLGEMGEHPAGHDVREQTRALKPVSTKLNDGKREKVAERAARQAAGLRATGLIETLRFSNSECGFGKLRAMSKIQSRNFFTFGSTR